MCRARFLQKLQNKFDLKNNWWLNSMTKYATPLQISSEWDENLGFQKYHLSWWPWAFVDLLVHVDLKNNCRVEFSDMKYKSFATFKSIRWKLRIYISCHWIQLGNYFWGQHGLKGQHRPKVINLGGISKTLNFHPIHLKFEEDLHIRSLNSTTNYFWDQICFMDFASIMALLHTNSAWCLPLVC